MNIKDIKKKLGNQDMPESLRPGTYLIFMDERRNCGCIIDAKLVTEVILDSTTNDEDFDEVIIQADNMVYRPREGVHIMEIK